MANDLLPVMELPIVPLRTMVLFPHAALPMTLNRRAATAAVQAAGEEGLVAVVTQAHPEVEIPSPNDLYAVGTGAIVRQMAQTSGTMMAILEGVERIALVDIVQTYPYIRARVRRLASERPHVDAGYAAQRSVLLDSFQEMVQLSQVLPDELGVVARSIADDSALTDMIASALVETAPNVRQDVLATLDVRRRLEKLTEMIARELESLRIRERLRHEVHDKIAGAQRESLLREQLKAIHKELGDEHGEEQQIAELRDKLENLGLPEEARTEALREVDRLRDMPPGSPEHAMVRTYLEWIASLPWSHTTAMPIDLHRAREILDEDHYDLEKVKERILEFLAVQRLRREPRAPLVCLIGPPGVGKTSIGRSIARATGREFVRISLGGTNDEAEIRGHRRTYIGALPGQIIRGLRRAGSRDPVFMLDELDKLGHDFRGDPAAALLEVLDPEQNVAFRDHYLDVPFDLSRVMFVATANVLDTIPDPLRDRMEVIELPGYVDDDKLQIAQRYLVPKQVEEAGLVLAADIAFTDGALLELVHGYTHEAGVRRLEQLIASLCRKRARQLGEGSPAGPLRVDRRAIGELLGPPQFRTESQLAERTLHPGVAVAVAWTPAGGEVLFVEAEKLPGGKGGLTLTGHLGDVMQESVRTALSWVRAHASRYGISDELIHGYDLHVHVPSGAVPKDGPSAGVVMATALVSLFTARPVRPNVALTGEITLSGVLLPIGGLKEKVIAARRSGVKELILPVDNEPNLADEVPQHLRGDLAFRMAATIEQAVDLALIPPGGIPMATQQKIQDVMTRDVHCVMHGATVREAAKLMADKKIGDVLVINDDGTLCGIVTDRDIVVRAVAANKDLDTMTVEEVESAGCVTLEADASTDEAVQLMRDKAIRRIPVVDHDKPIGIVSIGDLAQQRDPQSALGQISSAQPNN